MIVSVNVNDPAAPAVTVTDEPVVPEVIDPFPEMDQLCVDPAVAEDEYDRPVVPAHTGVGPEMLQLGFGIDYDSFGCSCCLSN